MIDLLKSVIYGIVEGITEWLPISSTGHLILLEEFLPLSPNQKFMSMFNVVIQLGAILAVLLLFFHKLNPFSPKKTQAEKKNTWTLWGKVVAAVIPSAAIGLLLDEWMDAHLYNFVVVSIMLIVYGVAFILVERMNQGKRPKVEAVEDLPLSTAMGIGAFQCLSLIPGTSRSGSTILGGILLGASRSAASEFSFFLAIPTMLGASALKLLKFFLDGNVLLASEVMMLVAAFVVAFLVSLLVIKALMAYVRRHSFSSFGVYRIILGALVLGYFLLA